jgi:hypothetical protein
VLSSLIKHSGVVNIEDALTNFGIKKDLISVILPKRDKFRWDQLLVNLLISLNTKINYIYNYAIINFFLAKKITNKHVLFYMW